MCTGHSLRQLTHITLWSNIWNILILPVFQHLKPLFFSNRGAQQLNGKNPACFQVICNCLHEKWQNGNFIVQWCSNFCKFPHNLYIFILILILYWLLPGVKVPRTALQKTVRHSSKMWENYMFTQEIRKAHYN